MKRASEEHSAQILKNSSFLIFAGFFSKALSAFYKIPFQNWTGDQGFYVYQQVYPFYALLIAFSSSSFPLIIAKWLVEKRENGKEESEIVKQLIFWLWIFGLFFFLLFHQGAPAIVQMMGDSELSGSLKSLSWACLIFPISSFLRGYFQSQNNTLPTSLSQIVEQMIRVCFLLIVALSFQKQAVYYMAQTAYYSVSLSAIGALLILLYFYQKNSISPYSLTPFRPKWKLGLRFLRESLLLTALNSLLILLQMIDAMTIFQLLQRSGLSSIESMIQKGVYDRGQPLVQIGLVIGTGLTSVMLPLLRQAFIRLDKEMWGRQKQQLIQTVTFFALAASVGLSAIMPYLNPALFGNSSGSHALALYALNILWMSLIQLAYTIELSRGRGRIALIAVISSLIVKWLMNYILVLRFGIIGASIATNFALMIGFLALWLAIYPKRFWFRKNFVVICKMLGLLVLLFLSVHFLPGLLMESWMIDGRLKAVIQSLLGVALGISIMLGGGYVLGIFDSSWFTELRRK